MGRQILIELNLGELCYYPFIISMNRYDGNCNTIKDPFGKINVPTKMKDVNLKVFNMIKGIYESKAL